MELLAIEFTGFILLVWSLKVLLTFSKKPIAVFRFKDAKHRFKIKKPGYYSIGVLGAGFIEHDQQAIIMVTSEEGYVSNARAHHLLFSSTDTIRHGVQCWGFSIQHTGRYTISFANLNQVETYGSMLGSSPIDHSELRILIHRSSKPIYQLGAIVALTLGLGLVLYGIFFKDVF